MRVDLLTLFPGMFAGPFDESMIKRAKEKGILDIRIIDIRDFSKDKHRRVDDRPYGGGPGMVMMAQPIIDAIRSVREEASIVIYMSPQGKQLTASLAKELAQIKHLIVLCGHYEGIDQRVIDLEVDQEVSIGDYVLTNGALPAMVMLEAVFRFVPQVLGHEEAAQRDSFEGEGLFDHPHYTMPVEFEGIKVPQVLLGGHHAKIEAWRKEKAEEKTKKVRPDLWEKFKKEFC